MSKKPSFAFIVCAFNENPRILYALSAISSFQEKESDKYDFIKVVVDDGSTDRTSEVAKASGFNVIRNEKNIGKSESMKKAVSYLDDNKLNWDYLFFLDADLIGISDSHLNEMVSSFFENKVSMTVGLRDYGKLNFINSFLLPITGERIISKELWNLLPKDKLTGYKAEMVMNVFAQKLSKYSKVILKGVKIVYRYEKDFHFIDRSRQFINLLRMFPEIYFFYVWLYLTKKAEETLHQE